MNRTEWSIENFVERHHKFAVNFHLDDLLSRADHDIECLLQAEVDGASFPTQPSFEPLSPLGATALDEVSDIPYSSPSAAKRGLLLLIRHCPEGQSKTG